MIHKDKVQIGDCWFDYVYSDLSVYIVKNKLGGNEEKYIDAYDPYEKHDVWTYRETDESYVETDDGDVIE